MCPEKRLYAIVRGIVQGVGFRYFVTYHARRLGLTGYVRNLPSGYEVEVVAEGPEDKLQELLRLLHQGPPGAVVREVEVRWGEATGEFRDFTIRF